MTSGRRAAAVGIALAILGIALGIQQSMQSSREHAGIVRTTTRVFQGLRTELTQLLAVTAAHASEANGDYAEYLASAVAQADVSRTVAVVDRFGRSRSIALSTVRRALLDVMDAYQRTTSETPSLPLEQLRVQGTVLSDRRQLAVLAEILRRSSNEGPDVAAVRAVERLLAS